MDADTTTPSEAVKRTGSGVSIEQQEGSGGAGFRRFGWTSLITSRWLDRVFLGAAILVAAAALWRLQTVVRWHLAAPFDLVFESPNLATIKALRQGVNVYDPSFFNAPPFIFTLYTPLYHLVCAALPMSAANPFLAGRLVALGFMALAVLGVLWVARPRNWAVVFLAVSLFCLLHPVTANAAFLKNDGTALFFSVLALLAVSNKAATPLRLAGAALCCVLALAAKQVFVSASAACFIYLLMRQRGDAFRFVVYYLLFAAAGAAAAQMLWGNGFWFCVLHAPRMPFSPEQFIAQWGLMLRQPVFVLLNAFWVLTAAGCVFHRRAKELVGNPFFLYFVFAEAVLLLTVGKPGSSTNYFTEPTLAGVFWLVSMAPPLLAPNLYKGAVAAVCLAMVLWELAIAKPKDFAFADPKFMAWRQQLHQSLIAEAESKPLRVLNLATASTFYDWPGETSVNDPYLYSLLWQHGVLKPDSMVRTLRLQTYDLIVFRKDAVWESNDSGDGRAQIMNAVREFYQPARTGSVLQYWTRKKTIPG